MSYSVYAAENGLYNEKLHNLYSLPYILQRMMRGADHVAHMGERRNLYKVLVRKPKGKRLHG
jgi:hypothetical protein